MQATGTMEKIPLGEKKRLVADFLARCNRYADAKIADYTARAAGLEGTEALANSDKLSHWHAYRAFNEHALRELASDALDDWFD
jgi:hypothetical protein